MILLAFGLAMSIVVPKKNQKRPQNMYMKRLNQDVLEGRDMSGQ